MMESLNMDAAPALPGPVYPECPGCGSAESLEFYSQSGAPVHSVLLFATREAAVEYPRGEIRLAFCARCGFIWNRYHHPALQEYSERCEETQGFSVTYNEFARRLASDLVERHGLRGKHILEIGCGKGEFLNLLCKLGGNTGTGFDPAFREDRGRRTPGVRFVKDFYSEKYSDEHADFMVCKMTLEHIGCSGRFISAVRRALGEKPTRVFFQVPDVTRVLRELAFWDVYYEHCSYFSPGSLGRLFRASGFDVTGISRGYGGQYLLLDAVASAGRPSPPLPVEEEPEELRNAVTFFSENVIQKTALWRHKLREFRKSGYRTVLWGSGSKGVAFLTTLGITDEIKYVVDVNPYRCGTFMAGTGHEIVSPEFVCRYRPDAVVLMNPVYRREVEMELERLGHSAEVLTV